MKQPDKIWHYYADITEGRDHAPAPSPCSLLWERVSERTVILCTVQIHSALVVNQWILLFPRQILIHRTMGNDYCFPMYVWMTLGKTVLISSHVFRHVWTRISQKFTIFYVVSCASLSMTIRMSTCQCPSLVHQGRRCLVMLIDPEEWVSIHRVEWFCRFLQCYDSEFLKTYGLLPSTPLQVHSSSKDINTWHLSSEVSHSRPVVFSRLYASFYFKIEQQDWDNTPVQQLTSWLVRLAHRCKRI